MLLKKMSILCFIFLTSMIMFSCKNAYENEINLSINEIVISNISQDLPEIYIGNKKHSWDDFYYKNNDSLVYIYNGKIYLSIDAPEEFDTELLIVSKNNDDIQKKIKVIKKEDFFKSIEIIFKNKPYAGEWVNFEIKNLNSLKNIDLEFDKPEYIVESNNSGFLLSDYTPLNTEISISLKYGNKILFTKTFVLYYNTYEIYNYIQFKRISNDLNGYYILMSDLNLSGINYTGLNNFYGVINGNGHKIIDFTYTLVGSRDNSNDTYGFIKNLNGTIKNLTFEKISINIYKYRDDNTNLYVGGICGILSGGKINNVHITRESTISADHYREVKDGNPVKTQIGGFVGAISSGEISNCSISSSNIYGKSGCGNNNGDCHTNVGAIVGEQNGGTITNCSRNNDTTIKAVIRGNTFKWGKGHLYGRAGGIVGYQGPKGILKSCKSAIDNIEVFVDIEPDWNKDRIYTSISALCGIKDGSVS